MTPHLAARIRDLLAGARPRRGSGRVSSPRGSGRVSGGRGFGRDGFTLIEVLAAMVVLAAISVVVTRGLVIARAGSVATDGYIGAEAVARTLMEGPVPLSIRTPGQLSGTLEGHTFLMVSQPIDIPLPKRGRDEGPRPVPAFVPLRITISVTAGKNRMVKLQTVRLVPREQQQ